MSVDLSGQKISYKDDIEPILQELCLDCHGNPPRNGAPSNSQYTSFNDAVKWSGDLYARVADGSMPPPEKGQKISLLEIQMLKAWIDGGFLLSDDDTTKGFQEFGFEILSLVEPYESDSAIFNLEFSAKGYSASDRFDVYHDSNKDGGDGVAIALNQSMADTMNIPWKIGILPKLSSFYVYVVLHREGAPDSIVYSDAALSIPNRNALPSVVILEPYEDTAFLDSLAHIVWEQEDPEGTALRTRIYVKSDSTQDFEILAEEAQYRTGFYEWDLSGYSTGSQYYLKIEVLDEDGGVNSEEAGPFSIVNGLLPTYMGQIKSIIEFRCNECHGSPADHDAPDSFNLLSYDSVVVWAERIKIRTVDEKSMPPEEEEPMAAEEIETLLLWIQGGMPEGEINLPPSLEFLAPLNSDTVFGELYTIKWQALDLDNDAKLSLYGYTLGAPEDSFLIAENLSEDNVNEFSFNIRQYPALTEIKIFASLFDGVNPKIWLEAPGTLVIPNRNAAPNVQLVAPKSYEGITDSSYVIGWMASDPEGDVLSFNLYYKTDSLSSLTLINNTELTGDSSFNWDISQFETGTEYRVYVEATDREGLSDWDSVTNVTLINGNIPTYFGNIKPIIAVKCNNCHGDPPDFDAPDSFNLLTYEAVVAQAENIMIRSIEERTMPPADDVDLTPEEREILTLWLQSGMIKGATNVPPSFSFSEPASAVVLAADSYNIRWSAEDLDNDASIDLFWTPLAGGDTVTIVAGLKEDSDSNYVFNSGAVPGGTVIKILARIQDYVNPELWVASKGTLETADRNTTPSLSFITSLAGELFANGSLTLEWNMNDPDGDALNVSIQLSTDSLTFTEIASLSDVSSYLWDLSSISFGLHYYLKIIVTDVPGGLSDTVTSSKFGIVHINGTAPTFYGTILPIFNDKCNSCHQSPFDNNAPETFDLSLYSKTANLNGSVEKGSQIQSNLIQDLMPPKGDPDLTASELEQIAMWLGAGMPEGQEGVSEAPSFSFITPSSAAQNVLNDNFIISWLAEDPDNDAVINLYYDTNNSGNNGSLIVSGLRENSDSSFNWNTSSLPSNMEYFIYSSISDGVNDTLWTYAPGSVFIPLRDNTKPSILISSPTAGQTFTDGSVAINWSAEDLDGDGINITLLAAQSDLNWTEIYNGANSGNYSWSTAGLSNGSDYRIRAVAMDDRGLSNEDTSDVFTIHSGNTDYRYTDNYIKPFFDKYCVGCHSGRAAPKRLKLDSYPNITAKPGNLDLIYLNTITDESMPPAKEIQPTAEERARLADWILGGAPQ